MLSICIPLYNRDVAQLHDELLNSAKNISYPYEIIIIDDASKPEYRNVNSKITSEHTTYIQQDKNVGRSCIRNSFINYAKYKYLLFLDCDSQLINENFLSNYAEVLSQNPDVLICGSIYPKTSPKFGYKLHWKYGRKCESNNNKNTQSPILKTNNFIIKKEILKEIKFDERIKSYGHEDTLIGIQLKQAGYILKTFSNPVLNSEPDTNIVFLNKTKEGILNLWFILSFIDNKSGFIQEVKLLRTYYKIKKIGFLFIFYPTAWLLKRPFKLLLLIGFNSIFIFNSYKLFFLILTKPKNL